MIATRLVALPILFSLACTLASLAATTAGAPLLTPEEKGRSRHQLQNLLNEMELLTRNSAVDRSDQAKIERDLAQLEVYKRIPLKDEMAALRKELEASAATYGLELKNLKISGRARPSKPVPASVFTDEGFRLAPDQVVEAIQVQAWIKGTHASTRNWIQMWATQLVRIVEPDRDPVKELDAKTSLVNGVTYRYREEKFPSLKPRDPGELLPKPARDRPSELAKQEPEIAELVKSIRAVKPKAMPLYKEREKFLLASARLDYFIQKTHGKKPVVAPSSSP